MESYCKITYQGSPVGDAGIVKKGLYYHFKCSCRLPQKGIYRLWAHCGQRQVKLGVCMPQEEGYFLSAQIPAKQLGEGDITVVARGKDDVDAVVTAAVNVDGPFERLSDLDNAFLSDDGQEICFKA